MVSLVTLWKWFSILVLVVAASAGGFVAGYLAGWSDAAARARELRQEFLGPRPDPDRRR